MHILVTDLLTCPRCGPTFGLVLWSDELSDRRVRTGSLGCPNCRARYAIEAGAADLRTDADRGMEAGPAAGTELPEAEDPRRALKLAAFLGVTEGPATFLLAGRSAADAEGVVRLVPGAEILAHPPVGAECPAAEGVSPVAFGAAFPLRSGALRGVVLEGEAGRRALPEGVRVLAPGGHVVLLDPPPGSADVLREAGLHLLLEAERVLVGALK